MAAASMLTAFAPPVLLRPSASLAPPRRASAAIAVRAAAGAPVLLRPSASLAPPRRASAAIAVRAAAKAPAAAAAPKKKRAATGITMPRPVSPALQAVVGASEVPRTEAIKRLWAYIKQNNLQDPADKKVIVCDEKLKVLFAGRERVGFLEVAKLLNPHFVKVP